MPSQDEYLDELLKGMSLEEEDRKNSAGGSEAPDIDALSEMSEEEIAKLLAAGTGEREKGRSGSGEKSVRGEEREVPGDVLDMLGESSGRDLKEIKDMLEKSDRNETIDQGASWAAGSNDEGNPVDKLLADIEEAGENDVAKDVTVGKEDRTQQKELRRQEKAAKKEAKKVVRQAAREEKAQKQRGGKRKSGKDMSRREEPRAEEQGGSSAVKEYDMMLDRDLLDSIVSGADQAGQRGSRAEKAGESARKRQDSEGGQGLEDLMSYARADLDAAESPEAEWVEETPPKELDIMALDMEEADALIEDRSEREQEEKKEGVFSKMLSFLTEEDEEESPSENEDVKLSDENEEILKDLDNEKSKKGSKAKKAKKKKPAKKEKKAKPKKAPKPKKEKKPREPEPYPLGKRVTLKKAMPIILFGVSLGAALMIFVFLSVDFTDKQAAETAYRQGDYETCYQRLFGKKLNEEEAMMYGRSESILYIRLWYHEYEMLAEKGAETEALDSLIQTVADYPGLYDYAAQWKAGMDVYEIYLDVLDTLYNKYGVTEAQALEIAGVRSDLEYTRIVTAIAKGYSYENWRQAYQNGAASGEGNQTAAGDENPDGQFEELEDPLPEESEMDPEDFVDNQ